MQSLGAAIIRLTSEVSEMRGELKGFVNDKAHALQRVEIRSETEGMIEKAINSLAVTMEAAIKGAISAALREANGYTDAKVKELEARLAAQEDRDKKREADISRQTIGLGVVGIAGILYALYNLITHGGG